MSDRKVHSGNTRIAVICGVVVAGMLGLAFAAVPLYNLFCSVTFLVPWCVLIIYLAIPWVLSSMKTQEVSVNAGGLILWPAKLMILLGFILLLAQAISEIIKRAAVIANIIPDPYEDRDVPPAVAEMELHDDDAPGASK